MDLYDPYVLSLIGSLTGDVLSRYGCSRWGVLMCTGKNWDSRDTSSLLTAGDPFPFADILHDERGGPCFADQNGDEPEGLICSMTDENGLCLCAWAECGKDSGLLGIGIDLASADDFAKRENGSEQLAKLVLDEKEMLLAGDMFAEDLPLGYAYAFSAKEAAFKSTAPALRKWYTTHSEELIFEVREFVQTKPGRMKGIGRKGAALQACDKLGISEIRVSYIVLPGAVFTIACAQGCCL